MFFHGGGVPLHGRRFAAYACLLLAAFSCVFFIGGSSLASFAGEDDVTVSADGKLVSSDEDVELRSDAEVAWQILCLVDDAVGDVWVPLTDAPSGSVSLSVPMVASAAMDGSVSVRGVGADGSVSDVIVLDVDGECGHAAVDDGGDVSSSDTVAADVSVLSDNGKLGDASRHLLGASPSGVADTYNIVARYLFYDGEIARSQRLIETVEAGEGFSGDVPVPSVMGYSPFLDGDGEALGDSVSVEFDEVWENKVITIVYKPALVSYTVRYYKEYVAGDGYDMVMMRHVPGYTDDYPESSDIEFDDDGDEIGFDGLYRLGYSVGRIAADGSTAVDVYFDRYYYLVYFDLDGGSGVDPVYGRYEAPLSVGVPTKPGYSFVGWDAGVRQGSEWVYDGVPDEIPESIPLGNASFKALWTPSEATYRVVYWEEKVASTDSTLKSNYRAITSETFGPVATDSVVSVSEHVYEAYEDMAEPSFEHYEHADVVYDDLTDPSSPRLEVLEASVNGDGSTILNVFYKRKTMRITFYTYRNRQWRIYDEYEGRYASTLAANGYSWPTNYRWYSSHSGSSGTGTSLGFLDAFMFDGLACVDPNDENHIILYGSTTSATYYVCFYKQRLDGSYAASGYQNADNYNMSTSNSTFTITDKYNGFTASEYYSNSAAPSLSGNWTKLGEKDSNGRYATGVRVGNGLHIHFKRNDYAVEFSNGGEIDYSKTTTLLFEEPLSDLYDKPNADWYASPSLPAAYEAGSYEFAGWYSNAKHMGDPYDFGAETMPAANLTLYAKWVPTVKTVSVYPDALSLDGDSAWEGNTLYGEPMELASVDESRLIQELTEQKNAGEQYGQYAFTGWFYDKDGTETQFVFGSTPVTKDLTVYAKWSSDFSSTYTIRYVDDKTGADIAAPLTGSALAGSNKVFVPTMSFYPSASLDDGLAYFPIEQSHQMIIDMDPGENEYAFRYVRVPCAPYMVEYRSSNTGELLEGTSPKYVLDNTQHRVMERFRQYPRYVPDSFQKMLTLQMPDMPEGTDWTDESVLRQVAENNKIVFWYSYDDEHGIYAVNHWYEVEDGGLLYQDGRHWDLYNSMHSLEDVGTEVSAAPLDITGYSFDGSIDGTVDSGTVTADGLELDLFYTANEYPYVVKYLDERTRVPLHDPYVGWSKNRFQVEVDAIDLESSYGYALADGEQSSKTITITKTVNDFDHSMDESYIAANVSRNAVTFLYKTDYPATYSYHAVLDGNSIGTVSLDTETMGAYDDAFPQGATAIAGNGSVFVGWFLDPECTEPVTSDDAHLANGGLWLMPAKQPGAVKGMDARYVSADYYAKFEEADITIRYESQDPTMGSVSVAQETVSNAAGAHPRGSKGIPEDGYAVIGWFKTPDDWSSPVSDGIDGSYTTDADGDGVWVPGRTGTDDTYEELTWYAGFAELSRLEPSVAEYVWDEESGAWADSSELSVGNVRWKTVYSLPELYAISSEYDLMIAEDVPNGMSVIDSSITVRIDGTVTSSIVPVRTVTEGGERITFRLGNGVSNLHQLDGTEIDLSAAEHEITIEYETASTDCFKYGTGGNTITVDSSSYIASQTFSHRFMGHDSASLYGYALAVTVHDAHDPSTMIPGVSFVLRYDDGGGYIGLSDGGSVSIVTDPTAAASYSTEADGSVILPIVGGGRYTLLESSSAGGYSYENMQEQPGLSFSVSTDGCGTLTVMPLIVVEDTEIDTEPNQSGVTSVKIGNYLSVPITGVLDNAASAFASIMFGAMGMCVFMVARVACIRKIG